MKTRSYEFEKCRLTIEFGDITTTKAQAIVSSDDHYVSMGGGVSAAILRAGGQEIIIDAAKKVPAQLGDVVVTTAGRLPAHYIFHAIAIASLERPDQAGARKVVRSTVSRCFDLVEALGLSSIAFPAIGSGSAGFSYEDVAVEMAGVIGERSSRLTRPLEATLFLYDRFGSMEPMDYIRFFEEFARRVPQAAAHELHAPVAFVPSAASVEKPAEPIARRQELRLTLNQLTEERTQLEEQLARLSEENSPDIAKARARLACIAEERIRILSALQKSQAEPVTVFISYSHRDQALREEFDKHLKILWRQGLIKSWHDRKIAAGSEWQGAIDENLRAARLILLLVSPDFMASDYCYDLEMTQAMKRHELREATVVPVILRPVMWDNAPFAKLQALPSEGKAVTVWPDRDTAFDDVARGIRSAVESILGKSKAQGA